MGCALGLGGRCGSVATGAELGRKTSSSISRIRASAESKATMWTPAILPNGDGTGYAFGWDVDPYKGHTHA